MDGLPAVALLLLGAALAVAAASVMSPRRIPGRRSAEDRLPDEGDRAIEVLVLASLAMAAGTAGAAGLSSGGLTIGGVAPFLLVPVLVMTPLAAAARRSRHGWGQGRPAGSGPHADH
jgi:hypothetical protein